MTPLYSSLDILTILFDTTYLIFIATTTHNKNNRHNHNNQHCTNINLNNSNLTKYNLKNEIITVLFICDYGGSYNGKQYIMVVQVIILILCTPWDGQLTNKMIDHRSLGSVTIKSFQY